MRVVSAVVFCGLLALGACSGKTVGEDDGDGGETAAPPVPAPKKCETYASTWCNKAFGCYVKVGRMKEADRQRNVDECYRIIVERLPCSEVTSVSADYDKCISQINGMACSRWDVPTTQFGTILPPSSCDEALSF
jgi:hypothetical protein